MDCVHSELKMPGAGRRAWQVFGKGLAGSLLGALLLATTHTNAGATGTKIETLSLARIPVDTTVEIRLPLDEGPDDIGLTTKLGRYFAEALTDLGYTLVAGDGELIFRFAAEEPTYASGDSRFRHSWAPPNETGAEASRGEILQVAHSDQTILAQSDGDLYRLRVSVARERKPPLWAGYIQRSVKGADRLETYSSMAKALMALWGRSHSGAE